MFPTNLSESVKSLNGKNPGTIKSLLAGLAIAWGSRTAMRIAQDATEKTVDANAYLKSLNDEIELATTTLSQTVESNRERVTDDIRSGYHDAAVKARAAALGWEETLEAALQTVYRKHGHLYDHPGESCVECGQPHVVLDRYFDVTVDSETD